MLYQPMSSPQMTRMLGFACSCAEAGDTAATVAMTASAIAAPSSRLDETFTTASLPGLTSAWRALRGEAPARNAHLTRRAARSPPALAGWIGGNAVKVYAALPIVLSATAATSASALSLLLLLLLLLLTHLVGLVRWRIRAHRRPRHWARA